MGTVTENIERKQRQVTEKTQRESKQNDRKLV